MCFTCSARKECENYQKMFTMYSKCTKSRPMSVTSLLNRVDSCDEGLEANLCTILQSVHNSFRGETM